MAARAGSAPSSCFSHVVEGLLDDLQSHMGSVSTTLARRKIAAVSVKATEPDGRTEATNPAGQAEDSEEGEWSARWSVMGAGAHW